MIARKGTFVVVADGRTATIYRIATRVNGIHLDDVEILEGGVAQRTCELGTARPGRRQPMLGPRSSVESDDLHDRAEEAFADVVAERLHGLAQEAAKGVILIAAPRFLGKLRGAMSDQAIDALSAQVDKDCCNLRIADLEAVVGQLDGGA